MNLRELFWIGCVASGLAFAGSRVSAADLAAEFDAANRCYAEGKYEAAADTYQKAIQEGLAAGEMSPVLYFNYGNAEFKAGHLGRAIAAYRRAERLTPRDSDVLGNLAFARNQVQGATVRPDRWQSWVNILTLNEVTWLTAALFWLACILFTVRQLRPAVVPALRGVTLAAVIATFLAAAMLAAKTGIRIRQPSAVVIQANAIARSGPFADAQNAFAVHDGAELSVLDRHDDWLQVADGSGKIGWLPGNQLELLPGA